MKLTENNYYSKEANLKYLSASQYKDFIGCPAKPSCEAQAMALLKGEWEKEKTTAMIMGSYADAYFEGTLEQFKENTPEIFTKQGTLKAEYKKADEVIARVEKDSLFLAHLSGEHQKIMTGKIFGVDFKIKMDSFFIDKLIVDLKFVEDIHKRNWAKDEGFMDFIRFWSYDGQLAIYQEIVRQNTGKKLPCVIACMDKTKSPDYALVPIDQYLMDDYLNGMEYNLKRIVELKEGKAEPIRCEKCDYCKATKVLKGYTPLDRLIEV